MSVGEMVAEGRRLEASGRLADACELYRRAIEMEPGHAPAYLNLGAALAASGDREGARAAYCELLERDAGNPYANYNLATLLLAGGSSVQATGLLRRALAAQPDFADAHVALAYALDSEGQLDAAAEHLRRALQARPDYAGAWYNLALLQRRLENPDAAEDALRRALAIEPDHLPATRALASLLRAGARIEEALELCARARRMAPESFAAESAELFTLLFSDAVSEAELFARHRAFGERLEARYPPLAAKPATPRPAGRRMRVGYLSPDLWRHPVALFLIPVLAHHDRAAFEVFCYKTGTTADSVTAEVRSLVEHWRDVAALDDEALARAIADDGIDILVDLAGHSGETRLEVLARQPAPVQATWLGYLHTSGTRCLRFRLCDAHTDPAPSSDALHTETLVRLPGSQWCYRPFLTMAHAPTPPCVENGWVTFGSFNQAAKISAATRERWRELLARVPRSRLLVASGAGERFAERLRRDLGVAGEPQRVRVVPRLALDQYFALGDEVDIALDTSPYSGGTTTCDALWMGVPVLTEPGVRSVSRSAASVLASVGLEDWIAPPGGYVALAAQKASDVAGLASLRASLRSRMKASALMDEPAFARTLETAYRRMLR
jgi:protein O-GlcNAc transferase